MYVRVVVAAFNQEKALVVGTFSVETDGSYAALVFTVHHTHLQTSQPASGFNLMTQRPGPGSALY